jgi:predicted amidophosphoribosyltransferase
MLTEFNKFRNTFQGNPQQIVMNMLSNGQMSQQQFNQLKAMADQFSKMMH